MRNASSRLHDKTPFAKWRRASDVVIIAAAALVIGAAAPMLILRYHDLHPDRLYQPYMAGPVLGDSTTLPAETIHSFRDLLAQYTLRQGVDDNFTIRVTDNRSGDLLELFVLEDLRRQYEQDGEADWPEIDRQRRRDMRRLIREHAASGIPRSAISVRWGRKNQIREARRLEEPFLVYEVNLARYLGLSLLATEIGTVETFNDDRLISPAGARGRYQMMPFLLRLNDLNRYDLRTAAGSSIRVADYWHPLIMMEPAFTTLRGYSNAVGHEIPGLSAYHAGPGNVFGIFRDFMAHSDAFSRRSSVVDAFVWALTDGYETVSRGSTFGAYSRGYVPSLYGSLRAIEDVPVDTSKAVRAERVRLKSGRSTYLSELLHALGPQQASLDLGWTDEVSLYEIFRLLNPHIDLPSSDGGAVPRAGDLRLVSTAGGDAVRFFLPLGTTDALARAGHDMLDPSETFRFEPRMYDRSKEDKTEADRAYAALVEDIAQFGFTTENRERLEALVKQFELLAEHRPTHFRRTQLQVIRTHDRLWGSSPWERLRDATARSLGEG